MADNTKDILIELMEILTTVSSSAINFELNNELARRIKPLLEKTKKE